MELDGELIFFPLSGSNLALWVSRLEHLNRPEFHLFDRDTIPPDAPKHQATADSINQRENCIAQICGKKEMENYLHKDSILRAYHEVGIDIEIPNNFEPYDDVPIEVAKLVHSVSDSDTDWDLLEEKKQKKKSDQAKHRLSSIAAAYMTTEMLDEIDQDGDVLSWFKNMKQLIS